MPAIFYDISHPVQALMLHPVIRELERRGFAPRVFGRDKDVCMELLQGFGLEATILAERRWGRLGAARELVTRELRMLRLARAERPLAVVGTSVHAARVGKLSGALSVVINDDDAAAVPFFAHLAYPLADLIVKPDCLAFENHPRQATYKGNQQLFYLHPSRFQPDPGIRAELGVAAGHRFGIVRLSALDAHHDVGVRGLTPAHLAEIARRLPRDVEVFVSAENRGSVPEGWRRIQLAPSRIHHVLAAASFFIGDGQSMAAEAAVLGTPAFRINDFVGRISYLKELEARGLAFGFLPNEQQSLMDRLSEVLNGQIPAEHFAQARRRMLSDMVDPVPWFSDLVSNRLRPHA